VLAALRWPSVIRAERAERRKVDAALERCGLTSYQDVMLAEVPYGTQKLVDVARAICSGAQWALLDEPTSGTTAGRAVGHLGHRRHSLRTGYNGAAG